jgi:Flp pilus assembly protein TadD
LKQTGVNSFGWIVGSTAQGMREVCMAYRMIIRFAALATFSMALVAAPAFPPAFAAGGGGGGIIGGFGESPPPPPASGTKATHARKAKKASKQSSIDPAFAQGYRAAYATIYDRNDYAAAIAQLKALGHDDHPNVANLIGYSYRKLGDYQLSQIWYERALKADPNHVLTWQYYGLWQIEQGNREQAQYHLSRIAAICGTDCEEYRSLADALEKPPGTGLVY